MVGVRVVGLGVRRGESDRLPHPFGIVAGVFDELRVGSLELAQFVEPFETGVAGSPDEVLLRIALFVG